MLIRKNTITLNLNKIYKECDWLIPRPVVHIFKYRVYQQNGSNIILLLSNIGNLLDNDVRLGPNTKEKITLFHHRKLVRVSTLQLTQYHKYCWILIPHVPMLLHNCVRHLQNCRRLDERQQMRIQQMKWWEGAHFVLF